MWIQNNDKVRSQTYLKNDMQNLMTQINDVECRIDDIIASINRVLEGMPSGQDKRLMDRCHETKNYLKEAKKMLSICNDCASQLDVMEWLEDDEYK